LHFSLSIVSYVLDTVTSWISTYGYPGAFLAALLETIFPPIPSELIFPLIGFTAQTKGLGLENAIGMATIGALGSTIGSIAIYFVALKLGKRVFLRLGKYIRIGESELNKSEKWFENHGTIAVFAGRMAPGIREIISIPAGISKMNLSKFIIFTFSGSLIWCISLTLVGYYIGDAWNKLVKGSGVFNIISIVIVVGILAVLGYHYYHKRHKKSSSFNNT
jgi:membrane protein DedA with SNARE-associated domain